MGLVAFDVGFSSFSPFETGEPEDFETVFESLSSGTDDVFEATGVRRDFFIDAFFFAMQLISFERESPPGRLNVSKYETVFLNEQESRGVSGP